MSETPERGETPLTKEQIEGVRAAFGNPTWWWGQRIYAICDMALRLTEALHEKERAEGERDAAIRAARESDNAYCKESVARAIAENAAQAAEQRAERAEELLEILREALNKDGK